MLTLGIDPGLATTGYGFVSTNRAGDLVVHEYGVVTSPAGMPTEKRLQLLHQEIRKLILLHCPQQAAVEKLFFQNNTKTAMSVSQARGVILLALAESDLEIGEYTPLEVKQAISGYGLAAKKQVQQMVQLILKTPELPKPDDAADALALAICHIQHTHINLLTKQP